ncbi:MAG: phosphoribosyltransferase [Simkaniaceae bacterium]
MARYKNRNDAGKQLAELLKNKIRGQPAVVFGLARGGIIIAWEIAKALNIPLGVIMTRKIGAPFNPELAIGAITETGEGYFDEKLIRSLDASEEYIQKQVAQEKQEAKRRLELYPTEDIKVKGCIALIVDDGIATGATMMAAIKSIKEKHPAKVIVAAPVAPPESVEFIKKKADEVICLFISQDFFGVSQFYDEFHQVTDAEIIDLLEKE